MENIKATLQYGVQECLWIIVAPKPTYVLFRKVVKSWLAGHLPSETGDVTNISRDSKLITKNTFRWFEGKLPDSFISATLQSVYDGDILLRVTTSTPPEYVSLETHVRKYKQ